MYKKSELDGFDLDGSSELSRPLDEESKEVKIASAYDGGSRKKGDLGVDDEGDASNGSSGTLTGCDGRWWPEMI